MTRRRGDRRSSAPAPGPRCGSARGCRGARPRPSDERAAGVEPAAGGDRRGSGVSPAQDLRLHVLASRARRESNARVSTGAAGRSSTSSVVPSSTMRPRYMTATRSAMFHASPRSWVTATIATPVSSTRPTHQRQDLAPDRGVEAAPPARRRGAAAVRAPSRRRSRPAGAARPTPRAGSAEKKRSGGRSPARASASATSVGLVARRPGGCGGPRRPPRRSCGAG